MGKNFDSIDLLMLMTDYDMRYQTEYGKLLSIIMFMLSIQASWREKKNTVLTSIDLLVEFLIFWRPNRYENT